MNRIDKCFQIKKNNILSVYFTAGYPSLSDTSEIIRALDKQGADMIEIGMPFSDPVADGPVIQQSSKKALENGMSLKLLFDQLKDLRSYTDIPVILMGYFNPVFKMGIPRFLDYCAETGVDGLILPDFPADEYRDHYQDLFEERKIHNILLITPQTSDERIREIDELSGGFIYMVSSYSTTGVRKGFEKPQLDYFEKVQSMNLKTPGLIGFGISDKNTFQTACEYARGAIVGTAFIKSLQNKGSLEQNTAAFIASLKS